MNSITIRVLVLNAMIVITLGGMVYYHFQLHQNLDESEKLVIDAENLVSDARKLESDAQEMLNQAKKELSDAQKLKSEALERELKFQSDFEALLQENIELRKLIQSMRKTVTDSRGSIDSALVSPLMSAFPFTREEYLAIRLKYATKQLKRLRKQIREQAE